MKFIITVDTEADNQWKRDGLAAVKNIAFLPRFQAICEQYGFPPTYLLTYEVMADLPAAKMFKEWQDNNKAEIGVHFHPWTTPPLLPEEEKDGWQLFPNELEDGSLYSKMKNLTEKFYLVFGRKPKSFRAGRFGLDERIIANLEQFGYLADCSTAPKMNWRKKISPRKRPDFRKAAVIPYHPASDNMLQPGKLKILEVPATVVYTGIIGEGFFGRIFSASDESRLKNILDKIFFRRKWLRIFPDSRETDWEKIYQSAARAGLPALEFMIHSSELMPGGSPYFKDKEAVDGLYRQLDRMFEIFSRRGVEGIKLGEFAKNYDQNND